MQSVRYAYRALHRRRSEMGGYVSVPERATRVLSLDAPDTLSWPAITP